MKATNLTLTIKRPWWAFWRKNKVINIPNAEINLVELGCIDNNFSFDVDFVGKPVDEVIRDIINKYGAKHE